MVGTEWEKNGDWKRKVWTELNLWGLNGIIGMVM